MYEPTMNQYRNVPFLWMTRHRSMQIMKRASTPHAAHQALLQQRS